MPFPLRSAKNVLLSISSSSIIYEGNFSPIFLRVVAIDLELATREFAGCRPLLWHFAIPVGPHLRLRPHADLALLGVDQTYGKQEQDDANHQMMLHLRVDST